MLLGETFLYWNGTEPMLCISDLELVKQILSNKSGLFVKSKIRPELFKLVGMKGLVFVEGVDWVRHRRILNPAFSIDRLKVFSSFFLNKIMIVTYVVICNNLIFDQIMTKVMVECTLRILEEWSDVKREQKMEMNREFRRLTADIIATAAFGSSYNEGIEVFRTQEELKKCCVRCLTNVYIPGTR